MQQLFYKRADGHINFLPNNKGYYDKFTTTIGDGVNSSYTITTGFLSQQQIVQVYNVSTGAQYNPTSIVINSDFTVTITFASPPSSNQYRVVAIGY